jgi:hypothetical protein
MSMLRLLIPIRLFRMIKLGQCKTLSLHNMHFYISVVALLC